MSTQVTGLTIRRGMFSFWITQAQHQAQLEMQAHIPEAVTKINNWSSHFVGKPQFIIEQDGARVQVMREDFISELQHLARATVNIIGQRLSYSEWEVDSLYGGEDPGSLPKTLHDVFVDEHRGVTVKTGNPFCNNSWQEFARALRARRLGIVEAKAPLGFVYYTDDPFGEKKPGRMFYKHMPGQDLMRVLGLQNESLINWALWEAGKLFSRLISAGLYLDDAHRLRNFFVEDSSPVKVFRLLDLEKVEELSPFTNQAKANMIVRFIRSAKAHGLLTDEKLGEFIIVCLDDNQPVIDLVQERLAQFTKEDLPV